MYCGVGEVVGEVVAKVVPWFVCVVLIPDLIQG